MSNSFFKKQLPLILVIGTITMGLVGWKEDKFVQARPTFTDTLPKKKIKNLDEALAELEKAQAELERSMKNIPMPSFDAQKMQAEIEKTLKEIDTEKLKLQVDQAMKQIDHEKIKAEIAEAMKHVDGEKIKFSIAEALNEVDVQQMKAEVQAAIASLDLDKVKKDLEELRKTELPKIEAEMKKVKPGIEAELKKAKVEIEKAKTALKEIKYFEADLEKDGLINRKNYIIEHKDGKLIINGQIQPDGVYNKYRSFLEKHKKFSLKKDAEDFDADFD